MLYGCGGADDLVEVVFLVVGGSGGRGTGKQFLLL